MRKKFLLESEKNKEELLLAFQFDDEALSVKLYIFPKKNTSKEAIELWIENEGNLPESSDSFVRNINDETLLPDDIKVLNPGKLRKIEIMWADTILQTRLLQGFDQELKLLKVKVTSLDSYSQETFDDCANFWKRIQEFRKENIGVAGDKIAIYKEGIDLLFDALKALRSDIRKEKSIEAKNAFSELKLQLNVIFDQWKEQKDVKQLVEQLKKLRASLNNSGLKHKYYMEIDDGINTLFEDLSEQRNEQQSKHTNKRINDLTEIYEKLQKSVDWDKKVLSKEERKAARSDQVFQLKLAQAKIEMISSKIQEKKEKLESIRQTLNKLKRKVKH